MVQTSGLAHMTIAVTDTERSLEFYRRHLGMTFLGGSHDCIILARVDTAPSTARLEDIHHAFIVDHGAYADAVEELRENGVDVFFEEDRQGGVVNGPRAYFHDPDGNVLEILDLTSYTGAE